MKTLRDNCTELGAKILTHTPAKKLLCDRRGNISGVVAESKEGEFTIAAKCIIIATGGYGNNREMLKKYLPNYHDTITYDGPPSNTGDGITWPSKSAQQRPAWARPTFMALSSSPNRIPTP